MVGGARIMRGRPYSALTMMAVAAIGEEPFSAKSLALDTASAICGVAAPQALLAQADPLDRGADPVMKPFLVPRS